MTIKFRGTTQASMINPYKKTNEVTYLWWCTLCRCILWTQSKRHVPKCNCLKGLPNYNKFTGRV